MLLNRSVYLNRPARCLPLSLTLYHNGRMSIAGVLRKLTCGPADILRLPLGRLERGRPADLVLFDPDRPWRIDADALISKSKNSPFDEWPAQGRVLRTVVAGRTQFTLDGGTEKH